MRGVTIQLCPNCILRVIPGQGIRWICDDYHPEVLAFMEQQKKERRQQEANLICQDEMADYDYELDI